MISLVSRYPNITQKNVCAKNEIKKTTLIGIKTSLSMRRTNLINLASNGLAIATFITRVVV